MYDQMAPEDIFKLLPRSKLFFYSFIIEIKYFFEKMSKLKIFFIYFFLKMCILALVLVSHIAAPHRLHLFYFVKFNAL